MRIKSLIVPRWPCAIDRMLKLLTTCAEYISAENLFLCTFISCIDFIVLANDCFDLIVCCVSC